MKKQYIPAELKVVNVNVEDILSASGFAGEWDTLDVTDVNPNI